MNEVKIFFTDDEMVAKLRELGGIIEERLVEKWSGNESFKVWVWQIRKANREWTDALPVYRQLFAMGMDRVVLGGVNALDLLNLIK